MIQKIFLITIVIRKNDKETNFSEFLKLNIDDYIGEFLPSDINFLEFKSYRDYYVDLLMQRIYPFEEVFNNKETGAAELEVYEFTFSFDKNIMFKELPWLESFINYMAEEYFFIAVVYPYLIKVDNDYAFRFPYRTITEESDDETKDGPPGIDFTPFDDNALFFKQHFYKEEIWDDLISGIAKTILLKNIEVVE